MWAITNSIYKLCHSIAGQGGRKGTALERSNELYLEYLNSEKWRSIKRKRIEIDGGRCVCCGSRGTTGNPLEVHHLSYKNIYHAETRIYEDLVTLCSICHKQIHNVMNRVTSPSGRRGWKDNGSIPHVQVTATVYEGKVIRE